jgi:hypothetical protein
MLRKRTRTTMDTCISRACLQSADTGSRTRISQIPYSDKDSLGSSSGKLQMQISYLPPLEQTSAMQRGNLPNQLYIKRIQRKVFL